MNRERGAGEAGLALILKDFVHSRQRSLSSLQGLVKPVQAPEWQQG